MMRNFLKEHAGRLWNIKLADRELDGKLIFEDGRTVLEGNGFRIEDETVRGAGEVYSRRVKIVNTSEGSITVTALRARFVLDRSDYEVYTQYNSWQQESLGGWSRLVTGVCAKGRSVRTSSGAAPFMALWNKQTQHGIAFHIIPDCAWSMETDFIPGAGKEGYVMAELGVYADDMRIELRPGDGAALPEILYYGISSKTDIDCRRLHRYCAERFPRRELPVIYNTWLGMFDRLDIDSVCEQISLAAEVGAEYFVIDAGWFGTVQNWSECIGDWEESSVLGFRGRMSEVADTVRRYGMKFGLWVEPERAVYSSEFFKKNGKYYVRDREYCFLDYSDPEAVDYMCGIIDGLVGKYGIKFFKFDFNADLVYDRYKSGFTKYFNGFNAFMQRLRSTHPDIYFECCASGGASMDLALLRNFDSVWPTDNQSPYVGLRIAKDTMLRMPPQVIERWVVIRSAGDVLTYFGDKSERILATGDAVWDHVEGVNESYLRRFMTGAPIGISCDLRDLSHAAMDILKSAVSEFKKLRGFWSCAECRVITDTEPVTVLEYSDAEKKHCIVQAFTGDVSQSGIYVYPELDAGLSYSVNGEGAQSGAELSKNGIYLKLEGSMRAASLDISAV